LDWTDIRTADEYLIFRYKGSSVSQSDLEEYDKTSNNYFADFLEQSGTYFYAVKSVNEYGISDFSNIIRVDVQLPRTNLFFNSLDIGDFGILAALVIVVQIIFTSLLYILLKDRTKTKKTKKK